MWSAISKQNLSKKYVVGFIRTVWQTDKDSERAAKNIKGVCGRKYKVSFHKVL